ncbi:MAG: hypothetical protein WCL50_01250 [Spirochaetota bacterium]
MGHFQPGAPLFLLEAILSGRAVSRADIETYRKLNSSYRSKLVFRFGDHSGFFSEFNNLVLAVLYCLDTRRQFVLYSPPDGSLSYRLGWNDYFLPFCEQVTQGFHKEHNERFRGTKLPFRLRTEREIYKLRYGFNWFTYELWEKFRSERFAEKKFRIPRLGINGDLLSATAAIIPLLWRFNPEFGAMVDGAVASISLPGDYLGLHIRGGDKVLEAKIYEPSEYMKLLGSRSELREVFVLTDDFRNVELLRDRYPGHDFTTLCRPSEQGYDFAALQSLSKESQYGDYAKLVASLEILKRARLTVGSYSTNPGMFMGMFMGERFIGVDSDHWLLKW